MKKFYSGNNRELLKRIHLMNGVARDLGSFSDRDVIMEYVLEKKSGDDFHVGSGDATTVQLVCRLCGADRLMVGQGPYFTAVKCINCGYEVGVHEG